MGLLSVFTNTTAKAKNTTQNRVVGIDVGSSSIKVVELQDRNDVVTLTTYGELQLGPYLEKAIGQSVVLPANVERQALVDVLRESAVHATQAVLAMPLSSSFVTVMSLLAEPEDDIEPRVRVEARKYIPVPMADVALDWAEIEATTASSEAKQRDVLIAAIQNDALRRFQTLMQTVELPKPPTEIECFSSLRSVYNEDIDNYALIDIGAQSTKLYIARKGLLQRMHRVPQGGMAATERIMADTKKSFEEVETNKRNINNASADFAVYQKHHHAYLGRMMREFIQVISEYENRVGAQLEQVYLVGGGSAFPGLDAYIGHELSRPTMYARPFEKVAYPAFMEDILNQLGPVFTPALGAALRAFE